MMQNSRARIRHAGGSLDASSAILSLGAELVPSIKVAVETRSANPMILNSFLHDEAGGAVIEYSLSAAAIALAIVTIIVNIGEQVTAMIEAVAAAFG
jgi:Flp pilus assembly pilin Flp